MGGWRERGLKANKETNSRACSRFDINVFLLKTRFVQRRGSLRGHFPSLFCPFLLLSGNSNYVPWRKRAPTVRWPPSLLKAVCTQRAVSVSRCQRLYQVILVKRFLSFAMRQLERYTHSFVSRSAILANLAAE